MESSGLNGTFDNPSQNGKLPYVIEALELYYTPILVFFGIFGNTISVYVFFQTKLKKHSSSFYLAALGISDSIFLLFVFAIWLNVFKINIYNKPVFCQVLNYSSAVCSFMSVWLVAAFTIERFIAVKYPLLRASICTTKRAKGAIAVLTMLAMLLNFPLIIMTDLIHVTVNNTNITVCKNAADWNTWNLIFTIIDTVVTIVIPMVVITVLNASISRTIWSLGSVRKKLTNRYGPSDNHKRLPLTTAKSSRPKSSNTSQRKLTKMLLVVSTVCLSLNLPSYVTRIMVFCLEMDFITLSSPHTFAVLSNVFQFPFYTNFGINFILYCISGQNFRKAVKRIFCPSSNLRRSDTPATESRTLSSAASIVSRKRRIPIPGDHQDFITIHQAKTDEV